LVIKVKQQAELASNSIPIVFILRKPHLNGLLYYLVIILFIFFYV